MIRNISSLSAGNGYVIGIDEGGRLRASFHNTDGTWPVQDRLVRSAETGIDAAVVVGTKGYLFKGRNYVRITPGRSGEVDAGYPRPLSDWGLGWGTFGANGVDAALEIDGTLYVFSGRDYIRISDTPVDDRDLNLRMAAVDPGFPKPISQLGLGAFADDGIDAAVVSGGEVYLFAGDEYVRVTPRPSWRVDAGYPKPISRWGWGDFGAGGVDAALTVQDRTYIFSGSSYIRMSGGQTDNGPVVDRNYPASIDNWGLGAFVEKDWSDHPWVVAGKARAFGCEVFVVEPDGSLVRYLMTPGSNLLLTDEHVLASGPRRLGRFPWRGPLPQWHRYVAVAAGSNGLYAVDRNGSLLYAHLDRSGGRIRLASSEPITLASGRGPGRNWDGFLDVTAGSDGALYGLHRDNRVHYYSHLGATDGSSRLRDTSAKFLPGISLTITMFAGSDGRIYDVGRDGDIRVSEHADFATGGTTTTRWSAPTLALRGWRRYDRLAHVKTADGTAVPDRGSVRSIRRLDGETIIDTDEATTTLRAPTGDSFRIFFQNMQLFPDSVDDVVSAELEAAVRAVATGAYVTAVGAVASLLGPASAIVLLLAGEAIKEVPSHRQIQRAISEALETPLYRGVGRRAQLAALTDWLRTESIDDVVALSEMFVPREADQLAKDVKRRFPYSFYGPAQDIDFLPGGLLILSRRPITALDWLIFRSGIGEDALSAKGVLFARIDDRFDVFVTHLQNGNPKLDLIDFGPGRGAAGKQRFQAQAIRTFIDGSRNPDLPAILLGDFNLDAAGGALIPKPATANAFWVDEQRVLRQQRATLVNELGAGDGELWPFRDARAATDGLHYYKKTSLDLEHGLGVLPRLPDDYDDRDRLHTVGADIGKGIDSVLFYQGLRERWTPSPLRRVDLYADHDNGQRRQISDHVGIRAIVSNTQRVERTYRVTPRKIRASVEAFHCYLVSTPRNGPDQTRIRLSIASGRNSARGDLTPERDSATFEIDELAGSPVEIEPDGDQIQITVDVYDQDVGNRDHLGRGTKTLSLDALRGESPLGRRGGGAGITFSRWWVGVIRGDNGAEYAVKIAIRAGRWTP